MHVRNSITLPEVTCGSDSVPPGFRANMLYAFTLADFVGDNICECRRQSQQV